MKIKTKRGEGLFDTDFLEIHMGNKKFRIETYGDGSVVIDKSSFIGDGALKIKPAASNVIDIS